MGKIYYAKAYDAYQNEVTEYVFKCSEGEDATDYFTTEIDMSYGDSEIMEIHEITESEAKKLIKNENIETDLELTEM